MLSGWTKSINISLYNSTSTLTYYQVKFIINRSSGTNSGDNIYLGTDCQADYGDIRFTSTSDVEYSYWIESYDASSATIWVKVPSVTGTAYTNLVLQYNNINTSTITTSNGTNVFVFFDDFSSGTLDTTTKWTVVSGQPYSVSGGILTVTGASDAADYIKSQTAFATNTALRMRSKWTDASGSSYFGYSTAIDANMAVSFNTTGYRYTTYVTAHNKSNTTVDTSWHTIDIARKGTSSVIFNEDGTTVFTSTTQLPTVSTNILFRQYTSTQQHDWVLIRTYSPVEPTKYYPRNLSEWTYRKSHTITHPSGGLTNYQTKLRIYRTTGTDSGDTVYVGDKCLASFGDIRFTNAAGTELDYWMEVNAGSYADFWVEVDSIGKSTDIYVYYGNSSATTTSNGDTTFPFFDDFSSEVINVTKWTTIGTPTVSGGIATITGTASEAINGITTFGYNYRMRTRASGNNSEYGSIALTGASANTAAFYFRYTVAGIGAFCRNASGQVNTNLGSYTGYHIFEINRKSTSTAFNIDNSTVATQTTYQPTLVMYPQFIIESSAGNFQVDWVFVSKCADTEPTHYTWGAEQDISATSFTIRITPTTGTDPLNVTYNCIIPEGTLTNFVLNYGDGSEYTNASQSSFVTTHTYDTPGTYTVWGEGYTEFATHVYYEIPYGVNVSAPAVVTSFTTLQTYNTITFTNTSTGNVNEWYWNFGDGSSSYASSPVHTYWSPATYNVTLYTSNQYQYSATTLPVTISQILTPPNAYFTPARLDVINPTLPYSVTFTNLSTPTFGCTYNWTIDGSTYTTTDATHSFTTHGLYDVGLTVTNTLGSSTRTYNDAIRLTQKSRTMNEVVGGADTFSTFGVQVFLEYATGSDLPIVYATILPEGVYFIQREIPDVPGIDEWGVMNLYSTINEWGVKIFNTLNNWGHKIMHNGSTIDRTPIRCIDVEIFEEVVNVSDDHEFDNDPT